MNMIKLVGNYGSSFILLVLTTIYPSTVFAYQGLPPLPSDFWRAWRWEPGVLLSLIFAAWLYMRGVQTIWRRAGSGRGIYRWQVIAFGSGLIALFIALISPLNAFGTAIFSAHMLQHLILILVAAPLLVLGAPLVPFMWALPRPERRKIARWWRQAKVVRAGWHSLTQPLFVWFLHTITLWLWHLPALYQAALEQPSIHELEHISFLGTALLFWWVLIQPTGRRRLGYGASLLYVFTTALQSGALGALLTFARTPLYPIYTSSAAAWNLTILEDQQLAGVIMWVPAGVIYLGAALVLLSQWLRTMEAKEQQNWKALSPGSATETSQALEQG
jgi:cytochrome c oxidase assembly factor CtaG